MKNPVQDLLFKWRIEDVLQALYDTCKTKEERTVFINTVRKNLNPMDRAIFDARLKLDNILNVA